jgi:hypothetical protein
VVTGTVAETADTLAAVWDALDALTFPVLAQAGKLAATGALAEATGYRSLKAWITLGFKVPDRTAAELASLAEHLHAGDMPDTMAAFQDGHLSLGEAATVTHQVDVAVRQRDKRVYPDAGEYRAQFEAGVLAAKEEQPALSCRDIRATTQRLRAVVEGERREAKREQAQERRSYTCATTFDDAFFAQLWGDGADRAVVDGVIEAFTDPPTDDDDRTRAQRRYDGLIAALKFAASHQGCEEGGAPVAVIRVTVPLTTLMGDPNGAHAVTDLGQVLPTSMVRELAPQAWVVRMVTDPLSGTVLDVGDAKRIVPPKMRQAAFHNHHTCAWPGGCDVPVAYCQADHITPWVKSHSTSARNTQPLCGRHNRAKHRRELDEDRRYWARVADRTRLRGPSPNPSRHRSRWGGSDPAPASPEWD